LLFYAQLHYREPLKKSFVCTVFWVRPNFYDSF
jgi:hypothetical protein